MEENKKDVLTFFIPTTVSLGMKSPPLKVREMQGWRPSRISKNGCWFKGKWNVIDAVVFFFLIRKLLVNRKQQNTRRLLFHLLYDAKETHKVMCIHPSSSRARQSPLGPVNSMVVFF